MMFSKGEGNTLVAKGIPFIPIDHNSSVLNPNIWQDSAKNLKIPE